MLPHSMWLVLLLLLLLLLLVLLLLPLLQVPGQLPDNKGELSVRLVHIDGVLYSRIGCKTVTTVTIVMIIYYKPW